MKHNYFQKKHMQLCSFLTLLTFLLLNSFSINAQTFTDNTYPGTSESWTVPPGVTSVTVQVWGGGGSGGGSGTNTAGGSGGGGYTTKTFAVLGGQTITYTIGVGGAVTAIASGNNGQNTTLDHIPSGTSLIANGGGGGTLNANPVGVGGTASGGTNTPGSNGGAVAGYADGSGIGLFGVANRTGYGVVGLTQPSVISSYVQTGEGVLGQADGSSGGPTRPIGVHGIIHETAAGNWRSTGVVGENNNVTPGVGFGGGPYATSGVTCGTYGNYASIGISSGTDMQAFGVAGDLLLIGGSIPDGSGGVFGAGGQGQFGMLGYNSYSGNSYGVYGGGGTNNGTINSGNTGRGTDLPIPNNLIGLGIHGGFMGGYIKGEQYGMLVKGKEFGMYVQGNTIVNKPIVQLIENKNSDTRTVAYMTTSTNVDVTTRGISSLKNGETFVAFKDAFKNLVSKDDYINVTVTPTSETNGVFVSKVTTEGFYIKENQKGKSNASFNWVAIGTRSGFENGVEISETILSNNFDKNINNATSNDGIDKVGFPIYFDGKNVLFERIPEKLVKQVSKETPKNK